MPACEKCWLDAQRRAISNPHKSITQHYYDLLEERKDNPCKEESDKRETEGPNANKEEI